MIIITSQVISRICMCVFMHYIYVGIQDVILSPKLKKWEDLKVQKKCYKPTSKKKKSQVSKSIFKKITIRGKN